MTTFLNKFLCIPWKSVSVPFSGFFKMSSTEKYFEGKDHAVAYKKYRGDMPEDIAKKIVEYLSLKFKPKECIAADIGCGSGQSTLPLSPYLKQIIGIDTSAAQIGEAVNIENWNISFKVGSAEAIPLDDQSVHLVYAMNAFHWFNIPEYFKEADRVLVPNGVLALCVGQRQLEIKGHEEESKALFEKFSEAAANYFDRKVELADNFYRDVQLPYTETVRSESTITEEVVSVGHIMGRLKTLSGTAKYLKEKPDEAEKLLEEFQSKLLECVQSKVSPDKTVVTLRRKYALLMGRKPS